MSRTLVIGSVAMGRLIPNFRDPKDHDVFSDGPYEGSEVFWHPSFEEWIEEGARYATLNELYTIKVSHSYWELKNGSWEKHINDAMLLKHNGAKLIPLLHRMLYKVWEETHGVKRVNLQMDKDEFFADAVTRKYDHDSVHYSVAYGDQPLYESVLKAPPSVEIDMNKVKALPFDDIVRLMREEVYATALERWVIPSDYTISPSLAYARAVKKTITSLTKGWTAQFMVENYDEFRRPDMDYVQHHKSKQHLLIPLEKSA